MFKYYRPKYHISAKYGWINDPNGFCFFNGKFHLFAQHYPYDLKWGPMHWLHFTSEDLINFVQEGISLSPSIEADKEWGCFSGSAIEHDNKLYVLYTGCSNNKQTQCLAISHDGHNFIKYNNNPVLDESSLPDGYLICDFRDPKIFKSGDTFYILLASRHKDNYCSILMYKTNNFIDYSFASVIKSFYDLKDNSMIECPDIIFQDDKCALIYSISGRRQDGDKYQQTHSIVYQVGRLDFNKGIFIPLNDEYELDKGFESYATQSLNYHNENYIVYWNSVWGINYPSKINNYAGQLSLIKKVKISDDNKLKLYFLPTFLDLKRFNLKLNKDITTFNINNIVLTFNKITNVIVLERKDMDFDIINSNKKVTNKCFAFYKLEDEVIIEAVMDNSSYEIIINNDICFSLLNYK